MFWDVVYKNIDTIIQHERNYEKTFRLEALKLPFKCAKDLNL